MLMSEYLTLRWNKFTLSSNLLYFVIFLGHHTLSFKHYDINYLRGFISNMRPEYKGGSGDIPKSLKYAVPKKPKEKLTNKAQVLCMRTEEDYIHVQELLKEMNREPIPVCLFKFISNIKSKEATI